MSTEVRPAASTPAAHRDDTGAKIGMWLFLYTEMLLFGGLFLLYAVYRYRYAAPFHRAAAELSVPMGTGNTLILLTSSLTMVLSIQAMRRSVKPRSLGFLGLTMLLGGIFLVNKYLEWGGKIAHGIYPGGPGLAGRPQGEVLFYGLYYTMTGLHGIHVVAGLLLLGVMFFLSARDRITAEHFISLENAGLYWHLVDLIWIYLFPLFYLIT